MFQPKIRETDIYKRYEDIIGRSYAIMVYYFYFGTVLYAAGRSLPKKSGQTRRRQLANDGSLPAAAKKGRMPAAILLFFFQFNFLLQWTYSFYIYVYKILVCFFIKVKEIDVVIVSISLNMS